MVCDCYHVIEEKPGKFSGECWGTKERERCYCNGDTCHCTYYPEKRNATIDVENKDGNMSKEKTILNTAEMWLKAQEDGKTYIANQRSLCYSKKRGLFYFTNLITCNCLSNFNDLVFDKLLSLEWTEMSETIMTKAEAEKKFGIRIAD